MEFANTQSQRESRRLDPPRHYLELDRPAQDATELFDRSKRRRAIAQGTGTTCTQTGEPTSTGLPVDVKPPVSRSRLKITKLSLS